MVHVNEDRWFIAPRVPLPYAERVNDHDAALAKRIGAAIRRRRSDLGWSQATLAERIETSVEYTSMLERGARLPSVPTLVALAGALGASIDDLVRGERSPRDDEALIAAARAVPPAIRPLVTQMLLAVAEPRARFGVIEPAKPRARRPKRA
jgi:transcriptional regulator with XRE-family HTH domain